VLTKTLVSTILIATAHQQSLLAQEAKDSKINTNLGMGLTVPLNPTGQFVGSSANAVVGVGYNMTRHHSLVGQFMWAGLPPNRNVLLPIRIVAGANNISGSSNLFTLTGNYRYQREGKTFGAYVIGGGGMYYRRSSVSRDVIVGAGTVCGPSWLYFGYGCVSGLVSEDRTLISGASTAFGGNGGVGFTIRINEDGYKFYVEARYHYAPNKDIPTTFIPVTLGFSW
jgi:hypothetical protein